MVALGTTLSRFLARLEAVSRLGSERLPAPDRPLGLGGWSSQANGAYGRGLGDGRCGSLVGSLDGGPGGDFGGGCVGGQGGGGGRGVAGSLVDIRTGGLGSQLARGHAWEGNVLDSQ
jgi:hypothetical protein